jgi:hypothetical protein
VHVGDRVVVDHVAVVHARRRERVVTMAARHPLRLIAPWYRWQRQREQPGPLPGPQPRGTRPVFQKYVSSGDAVKLFLGNPQRSLRFFDDEDRVVVTELPPGPPGLFNEKSFGYRYLRRAIHTPVRKLYRDTHRRAYLVVAEMHCEAPGLPDASWSHIGQIGLVVRRWTPLDPVRLNVERERLEREIALLRFRLNRLRSQLAGPLPPPPQLDLGLPGLIPFPPPPPAPPPPDELQREIAELQLRIAALRTQRAALEVPDSATWKLQYWEPHAEHEGIGSWRDFGSAVSETPASRDALREKVYPLYRLIPDPKATDHLSLGARLLFGAVPTGDMETTDKGEPHFDSLATYEIRCFVQQLKECCSGRPERGDCPDQLRWTAATEPYRIAGHFDPVGSGNTVVNIEMPDMRLLAAQPPRGFPLRLHFPPDSKPTIGGFPLNTSGQTLPLPMMCTTSIPLITIVATIVLEIVTPIVVNLLRLYHLLFDKFCFGLDLIVLDRGIPGFAGSSVNGAKGELNSPDLADDFREFSGRIDNEPQLPSRTERLVWEPVLTERPKVEDPALVGVA